MTFQELLADPPKLHIFRQGPETPLGLHNAGELVNRWKLSDDELRFIEQHVTKNSKTLETGGGCSTVLFAMKGTRHTCIIPDQELANRIVTFCNQKGISTSGLTFIIEPSETALPKIDARDFDLVLIDGRHGFPQPFLDWYYAAEILKIGGYVIIDDLHVWVCETLMEFLIAEKNDWALAHESLGGCVFKKLGNGTQNNDFGYQPFVHDHSRQFSFTAKLRYLRNLLKRGNYGLFIYTIKLGLKSAMMGKFGERPMGRR